MSGEISLEYGKLPDEFHVGYDGVDFDRNYEQGYQSYNENGVEFICQQECNFFCIDDEIDIYGSRAYGGYDVYVAFDSEVGARLFGDGGIVFSYDEGSSHIRMYGYYDDLDYPFYDPAYAIDVVVAAMSCYAASDEAAEEGLAEAVSALAGAIEADREHIEATAMKNTKHDERMQTLDERERRHQQALRFWGG